MKTIRSFNSISVFLCIIFAITACLGETRTVTPIIMGTQSDAQPQNSLTTDVTSVVSQTNVPTMAPAAALVQPVKYSLDIKGAEWLLRAAQEGLSFRVVGIYSINNQIAFLFGSFASGTNDVRSVLFRTEDGGQHWLEVMPSFTFSDVSHVLFVQNGIGWASIGWTSEGLLGTTFWHTSDYGKSWEEIPNVNTGPADVLGIEFFDSSRGQRILFEGTGNPDRDGLVLETTNDGGNTWQESLRYVSGTQDRQKIIAAYANIDGGQYGSHWGTCKWDIANGCQALGQDGSEWNVTYDESIESYIVSVQSLGESELLTYKFPVNFIYEDGDLRAP